MEDVSSQFPYTGGEPLIIRIVEFVESPKAAPCLGCRGAVRHIGPDLA